MTSANAARRRRLTPRQREALTLRANGYSNPQVAARMYISRDTVKTLLSRCYLILGVFDATQAAAVALILGEIDPDEIHIPNEQREGPRMPRPVKRRCRICKAEEGKQHTVNCTFVTYRRHYPRADIYIDVPDYSSSSSSSCDTGSTDAGSCGG